MTTPSQRAPTRAIARPARILNVKKGQLVLYQGRAARVLAVSAPGAILLRIDGTHEDLWTAAGQLSGYLAVPLPEEAARAFCPDASEPALVRAMQWKEQFDRYVHDDLLSVEHRAAIAQTMEASTRTVESHFDLYRADASPQHQLGCKPGPEKGTCLLPAPVEAVITKAIKDKYETAERPGIQDVVDYVGVLANAAGLRSPSYGAVSTRIHRIDRWQAARKRHGRVHGDALAAPAGPSLVGLHPLDFVQMDHAIVDLIVVDPDTREEIGRPWITLALDIGSRCVLGFYLTFDDPSQTSVALCLEHACCPKDEWLAEIGYEGEWLPFGLMKAIGWDNAKCFKPQSLVNSCRSIGIDPRYRAVRHPTHGAHIERLVGTYMGKVHVLKGTTFSNTKQREDYRSGKRAVMSLPELILWTTHQINGVYHNTPHEALDKRTPLEVWQTHRMREGHYELPPYPADRRAFRMSLLPGVYRQVTRAGLSRFDLRYWDEALIPLIGNKQRYWVAHDPRNISRVYLHHDNEFLDVPWADRTRRPIALFELQRAKRALKALHDAPCSEAAVFQHLERMHAIEDEAEHITRATRRDRARRPKDDRPPEAVRGEAQIDYSQASVVRRNPLERAP